MIFLLLLLLLLPVQGVAHTTPCPPLVCPDVVIWTPIDPSLITDVINSGESILDGPYWYDKRLSAGLEPWDSPQAAILYTGFTPIRSYQPSEFISVDVNLNSSSRVPYVYQLSNIFSAAQSACITPESYVGFYTSNSYTDTFNNKLFVTISASQVGCPPGKFKFTRREFTGSTLVSSVATCFDGVWNGDETGIDCGGSCSPGGDLVTTVQADMIINLIFAVGLLVVFGLGVSLGMKR